MLPTFFSMVLLGVQLASAAPLYPRLTKLDAAATAEAQKKDTTATRAFTAVPIKTSDGKCLNVVSGSGDFRENLAPIQAVACDGSVGQQWDIITKGIHNDQAGQALIVSTLTNACMNFDPRRAAGNQVITFSCGGRADGDGKVTDSQLFAFSGGAGPIALAPQNGKGAVVFTVKNGLLDQAAGDATKPAADQLFTIGGGQATGGVAAAPPAAPPASAVTTPAPVATPASATIAAVQSVSRAGVVLNPSAAAEANPRDTTATRALSGVSVKTSDGKCLTIDQFAGDFRENLIPVQVAACDGSAGQKFDVITKGIHNDQAGQALIVSTLTQGCMNFDPRRAAGDQLILFSCGGRADGDGKVTDSQLFAFDAAKTANVPLVPKNGNGNTVLTVKGAVIDVATQSAATASGAQLFSFA
jgi:hypothetical protein